MSETIIIGKPTVATVKVSSTDGHRITTPVTRPVRRVEVAKPVVAQPGAVAAKHHKGTAGSSDITISKTPTIEHTTSNSSSRTVNVSSPTAGRVGRQQPHPALVTKEGDWMDRRSHEPK